MHNAAVMRRLRQDNSIETDAGKQRESDVESVMGRNWSVQGKSRCRRSEALISDWQFSDRVVTVQTCGFQSTRHPEQQQTTISKISANIYILSVLIYEVCFFMDKLGSDIRSTPTYDTWSESSWSREYIIHSNVYVKKFLLRCEKQIDLVG